MKISDGMGTDWQIGALLSIEISTDANKNTFSLFETRGIPSIYLIYLTDYDFASSNSEYSHLG